jgi:hypothetical protein
MTILIYILPFLGDAPAAVKQFASNEQTMTLACQDPPGLALLSLFQNPAPQRREIL